MLAENIIRINIWELIFHVHTLFLSIFSVLFSCTPHLNLNQAAHAQQHLSAYSSLGSCYSWADDRSPCPAESCEEARERETGAVRTVTVQPFHLHCTQRLKNCEFIRKTLLHGTQRTTVHKLSHVSLFCRISSMYGSSWQWLHFSRIVTTSTHQSSSIGPESAPQGSCLSILNHHRGPALSLAPPAAWAPALLGLGSKAD